MVALAQLLPGLAAGEPGELEKYFPLTPHLVRWYSVKDVQSGAFVGMTSFTIVAKEDRPGGGTVYFVENRAAGVSVDSVDYQEVTAEQVQLNRIVTLRNEPLGVTDVRFDPPLPMLRAPLDVGHSWSATPKGDETYTYRVESKFTSRVQNREHADCVRVVRTRGGTPDYKTEYCPRIGITAFEILSPGQRWLRGQLTGTGRETEFTAIKSSTVHPPPGCEYTFSPLIPGGKHVVTVMPPRTKPITFERPAGNMLHINVAGDAPRGEWFLMIRQGNDGAFETFQNFYWQGVCSANFLVPPPSLEPSVSMIRQEAGPGRVTIYVIGVGWKPAEPLGLTITDPGGKVRTSKLGNAGATGVSGVVVVPFEDKLERGIYKLAIQGADRSASLTIECPPENYCSVGFWRKTW